MKCLLRRMLDPQEFLSDYGVRGLSKYHQTHPFQFNCGNEQLSVQYQPAESDTHMFGGNSNWRGWQARSNSLASPPTSRKKLIDSLCSAGG